MPTASTTALKSNHSRRKGPVTDVSSPKRSACPGTLAFSKVWFPYSCASARMIVKGGRCGAGTGPPWRVAEDAMRLKTGEERSSSLQECVSENTNRLPARSSWVGRPVESSWADLSMSP